METKAVNTTAELEKELGMSEQELFSFVEYHAEDAERIGYSEYSYWKSVFRNFLKNKAAVVMIIVFFAIFIFFSSLPFSLSLLSSCHSPFSVPV